MSTTDRRMEIINILVVRRRTTARELAEEFGVTRNGICFRCRVRGAI